MSNNLVGFGNLILQKCAVCTNTFLSWNSNTILEMNIFFTYIKPQISSQNPRDEVI